MKWQNGEIKEHMCPPIFCKIKHVKIWKNKVLLLNNTCLHQNQASVLAQS